MCDSDKNQIIDKSEFKFMIKFLKEWINLWNVFKSCDKNNDMKLSKDEFKSSFKKLLDPYLQEIFEEQ